MRKKKEQEHKTLARWIIDKTNTDLYRAGMLCGWKHPEINPEVMELVGGRQALLEKADILERETMAGRMGKIKPGWKEVKTSIQKIDYDVSIIPELCEREQIEDPRKRQLRLIACVEKWRRQGEDCAWLCSYYDDLLDLLRRGKEQNELEDEKIFACIDAIAHQNEPVWKRRFSTRVLGDSKCFEKQYEKKMITILKNKSPFYIEGMSGDEILNAHNIHTYAQTLEWKGALQYQMDEGMVIDTSAQVYGTVINAQTMEHAKAVALPDCRRIMTIENKANYEDMRYRKDTLYIFCHGFFSPKEVRFLKGLCDLVSKDCTFYHWGDMDYGGICIFQFIQSHLFPKLLPYKMGVEDFETALQHNQGMLLKEETREKLEKKNAGVLEPLKEAILRTNRTIEQECLLQENKEEDHL